MVAAHTTIHTRSKRITRHSESDIITKSSCDLFLCGRTQRSAPTRRICFKMRHHQNRSKQKTVVSQHQAASARTGCIHRASGHPFTARQASSQIPSVAFSCAGGLGGPPLRGGFDSIGAIIKAGPNREQWFRNTRRHRHARDASTAQANTQ